MKTPDYELCIRFVKFHVDEENVYVLATSLSKEDMSVEKLKQIYQMRWGIETSYRTAKYVLGLETVHSKKSECIIQEIYAELIMYNFSMYIAAQVEPRPSKGKHPVQINFTQAVKICMDFFRMSIDISPPDIEAIIQKFTLPVRDNRSVQRIVVSPTVHGFNYRLP